MTMTRSRTIALALTLVMFGVFVLSVVFMALRAADFYRTQGRPLYTFKSIGSREFTFAGHPVSLTDEPEPGGRGEVLVIRYGDQVLRVLPGVAPNDPQMPGLSRHADWLRVFRFAERGRTNQEEFAQKLEHGEDRLAIVARRPVDGPDPRTGIVGRRDWKFEFYELLPDGTIHSDVLLYPKNRPGRTPKPGQIQENTWQFDAAMMLMPAFGRPNRSFTTDALHEMGWTLPAAAFSGLVLMFSITALFAPNRRWPAKTDQAAG